MAAGEVHNGDFGTTFVLTVKDQNGTVVDISTATTKQVLIRTPYGKILTKTGTFTTTGTDGKLQYTTISGDINATGIWLFQAYVVTSAGSWKSDMATVTVYGNIS